MSNRMRLCDAGIREQEWAQKLIQDGKLPKGISYKDLLDHGLYDSHTDEIVITIKAATRKFKVDRG